MDNRDKIVTVSHWLTHRHISDIISTGSRLAPLHKEMIAMMKRDYESFGELLLTIRKENPSKPSLRATAAALGISPQYYSEVENNKKGVLSRDRIEDFCKFMNLDKEDTEFVYNKAAEFKNDKHDKNTAIPQDFSNYIMEQDYVVKALRVAKEFDAGEDEWLAFIEEMRRKRENED